MSARERLWARRATGIRHPKLDLFSHETGRLGLMLLGWQGGPHDNPLHLVSNGLIFGEFILLALGLLGTFPLFFELLGK